MKQTDFDAIAPLNPSNITAALVVSPGVHWDPERPKDWPATSYDAPPRIRPWTGKPELNCTGQRYGRILVIGALKANTDASWSLWLVRCQCGAYEDRTAGAIAGKAGPRCWSCDRLWRMQEGMVLEPSTRSRHKPKNTTEVVLASNAAKRAPRTALQTAMAEALLRKTGT